MDYAPHHTTQACDRVLRCCVQAQLFRVVLDTPILTDDIGAIPHVLERKYTRASRMSHAEVRSYTSRYLRSLVITKLFIHIALLELMLFSQSSES